MIEQVGEKIDVMAAFQQGHMHPRYFYWHRRCYKIIKITSAWNTAEGQFRRYFYTVSTEHPELYEIMLSTRNMQWELVSIYHDS